MDCRRSDFLVGQNRENSQARLRTVFIAALFKSKLFRNQFSNMMMSKVLAMLFSYFDDGFVDVVDVLT